MASDLSPAKWQDALPAAFPEKTAAAISSPAPASVIRSARSAAKTALLYGRGISQALVRRGQLPRVAVFEENGSPSRLRSARMAESLRSRGWSTISLPARLGIAQRKRILRLFGPDLIVLQQCRHPGDRVEHLRPYAYVLDVDDADFLDPKLTHIMEEVASTAQGVIAGSRYVADWAEQHNPATEVIWTGSKPTSGQRPAHRTRAPIVTWAQASPMLYRRELDFVTDVLLAARASGGYFRFRLYGCQGTSEERAAISRFEEAGIAVETLPPMPYAKFLRSLRECAIGLSAISPESPYSQGKSFGKILGYLDAKVPIICSDAADHAKFFMPKGRSPNAKALRQGTPREEAAPELGIVSSDPSEWTRAVLALLSDPVRRQTIAEAGYDAFLQYLSLDAAANRTDQFLRRILPSATAPEAITAPNY